MNIVKRVSLIVAALLLLTFNTQSAFAQSPDCLINFKFTTTGSQGPINQLYGDNRQNGCIDWTMVYQSTGFSAISISFQSATGAVTPGTFGSFSGTVTSGSNPSTNTTAATAVFSGYVGFYRVNLGTATGTGTVIGVLYGRKSGPTAMNVPSSTGVWTVSGNDIYNSNSGLVGVGGAPLAFGGSVNGAFQTFGTINSVTLSADAFANGFVNYKRGRTGSITGTPAIGSELGYWTAKGWNGSAYTSSASGFGAIACENWTLTANCARIQFWTTPSGTTPNQYSMVLTDAGHLGLLPAKMIGFSSSTSDPSLIDTAISRNAAGVMETNTGTPGTIGTMRSKYNSSDNTAGTTGNGFKDGICVTASGGCGGSSQLHVITFVIDGGGSAITTGALKDFPTANFTCTINKAQISADQSGSITVDIWKAAGAIPTSGNKISASAPVTLSSAQINQNSALTAWTTAVTAGDVFGFSVASVTSVTHVVGQIWCL